MRARRSVSAGRGAGGWACASIQPGRGVPAPISATSSQGPGERGGRRVVVGAALEAVRRLGRQPEAARRAPHLGGREVRALDGDGRRGAR